MQSQNTARITKCDRVSTCCRTMVPIGLFDAGLPQTFNFEKKKRPGICKVGIEQGMPVLEVLARTVRQEKRNKGHINQKGRVKLSIGRQGFYI